MSFYINEFKQHLADVAKKVDRPYDEPASRRQMQETRTVGEVYASMPKRPVPQHLMEQITKQRS